MKHPTETTDEQMEVARKYLAAADALVESLLDSAAVEDSIFIERARGAFSTGGLNLRITLDVPGGGYALPRLLLQSVTRTGSAKTISEVTFKFAAEGKDVLQ